MKILYATDGSQAAVDAMSVLTGMFRREVVKVKVVSVTHSWSLDPGHVLIELDPIAERRGDSHKIVNAAAEELTEAGFDASTMVLEGLPGRELMTLAQAHYELIIVGAGSHSWLGNHLLGSVSTYVLHEAPCSVVVVHEPTPPDRVARAVVGVDGSNTSDESVKMLARILDPKRCEIDVLSVVAPQVPALAPGLVPPMVLPDAKVMARAEAELTRLADGHVRAAAGVFRDAGFKTAMRVEHGGAATVLLEEARQSNADLIAVGSRGLGPIRRAFLGSVSDQVARHARAAFVGRFWTKHEHQHEEVD